MNNSDNIFDSLQEYGGKWEVVNTRKFTKDELGRVKYADVQQSDISKQEGYGLSVCFHFHNGKTSYLPLSRDSQLGIGESVNLSQAKILTLERDGDHCIKIEA